MVLLFQLYLNFTMILSCFCLAFLFCLLLLYGLLSKLFLLCQSKHFVNFIFKGAIQIKLYYYYYFMKLVDK